MRGKGSCAYACHDGILEIGGVVPHILNLGTTRRCVVCFMHQVLYTWEAGYAPKLVWSLWRGEKFVAFV